MIHQNMKQEQKPCKKKEEKHIILELKETRQNNEKTYFYFILFCISNKIVKNASEQTVNIISRLIQLLTWITMTR